ncbi:HAD hydrolase-like protein [Jonesia quinghaiensis]|uniref:HAD hydrolase-like protein n=1 Tax=Jonesia quinghaiensis TaxID=262806 RepID=UPI00049137BB|nr:HAD hydrolase-like protein [Jonesia quinghaiensis]
MSSFRDVLLVDLDGTLTDSAPGIIESITFAYQTLFLPVPSMEELRSFVGPPLHDSAARHGVPPELMPEFLSAYRVAFVDGGMLNNSVYAGVRDMLEGLSQQYRLVIATSKPEVFARQIIRHFGLDQFCEAVCGASLDGVRSTKAEVIAHALETLRTSEAGLPGDARITMIGDREHDVLGAAEHGLPTVGVRWGYAEPEELENAGAVAIARKPAEVAGLVAAVPHSRRASAVC